MVKEGHRSNYYRSEREQRSTERLVQMMADNDPFLRTIGKLEGTLEQLDARLKDLDSTMKTHLQTMAGLEPRIEALDHRVKTLENGKDWVLKTVGGVILAAILGLVVVKTGIVLPK